MRMHDVISIKNVLPGSQGWTCKVTVQEKQQITGSTMTPTKKQKLILLDPEGSQVEGIIFNNDIPKISPRLQIYKKYLISDAIVRLIPEKYQTSDLKIQCVITSRTVIERANDDDDILPVKFNYTEFSNLVNFIDDKEKSVGQLQHYVLGIVVQSLDVEKILKFLIMLTGPGASFVTMLAKCELSCLAKNLAFVKCEVYDLAFDKCETVVLSLWDDFVTHEGYQMTHTIQNQPVVVCRRVTLSTWFDSAILIDPPIEEAGNLKKWARKNSQVLSVLVTDAAYMKFNPDVTLKPDQKITKIILLKPAQKSSWVKVSFSFEHIFQKFWYMGCKKCFRSTAAPHGVVFTCNSCRERCRFDIDLTDTTGTVTASIFGELAETLLTFTALEAMDHFTQNIELPLEKTHAELKQKLFLAHIRPVQSQLADAKQRYTIIYYCETTDHLESELLDIQEMPDNVLTYNETANSASIASVNEGSSSRVKSCLAKRFEESKGDYSSASPLEAANSPKRAKLS
ncbi:replication protein A 70 kDa DNA-binding subunit B-like [Coffea eugenioides]|uniref:replication protein A 70 kDa DNA-binding subunit B-like n=1 Tax=Coffea eugenioides TaxID=49369 RepID=UPI000F60AFAB|nr:replication protein A 70 kDa DNA-binding subunit B-like [Coffea eugenioides]